MHTGQKIGSFTWCDRKFSMSMLKLLVVGTDSCIHIAKILNRPSIKNVA